MPEININISSANKNNYIFINYWGFRENGPSNLKRPFIIESNDEIRWYLNYLHHPILANFSYGTGLVQLRNGNFVMGVRSTNKIYEINYAGEIFNTLGLQGYYFHHHVYEKPNGNFLVTSEDPNRSTVEDIIVEIDRDHGGFVCEWDQTQSLDPLRQAWPNIRRDNNDTDWCHANGVYYDPSDSGIIVSCRVQGTIKLSPDNQVQWILAPHRDWNDNLTTKLLKPLDNNSNHITNHNVLDGTENHPEFEWAWYQHSPILLPNGNLMLFDNGDNRNYTGELEYSRAVEYHIDEGNKTVQQMWEFGKSFGQETFSPIVSKVNYYEDDQTVLFASGCIKPSTGKVILLDYSSKINKFEASIVAPDTVGRAAGGIAFHSVCLSNF